jgi:DNA-binding MarR family transcriptional regulator
MADPNPDPDLVLELHAFVTHLHTTANRDLLNQIRDEGLTFQRIQLLERLRGGRVRPTIVQCARIMFVAKNSASRMVEDLAARGYVKRVVDDNDSRIKRVEITPAGEDVLVRLHAARMPAIEAFTEKLTSDQRRSLHEALDPILNPQPQVEPEYAAV